MELNYFASIPDAVAYLCSELLSNLADDLERMGDEDANHYTENDREEKRECLADLVQVVPSVMRAFSVKEEDITQVIQAFPNNGVGVSHE